MRHRSGKHYDGQAQESHPQADRCGYNLNSAGKWYDTSNGRFISNADAGIPSKPKTNKMGGSSANGELSQIEINKINGRNYEIEQFEKLSKETNDAVEQLTIRTNDGTELRIDGAGFEKSGGQIRLEEYKSSPTAPLTPNQKKGFLELQENGGVVIGKGKGEFYPGMEIPAGTKVEIVRRK